MKTLETKRLLLRPFRPGDLDGLYAYARSPQVGPAAGWKPHANREESRVILESFIREGEVWAVVEKAENKLIGSVGLHKDTRRSNPRLLMVGYVLAEDAWGKGYATEFTSRVMGFAFDQLDVDLLTVYHFPFNQRSRRVIEKSGFRYEGTLRQSFLRYDGMRLDEVCYSITREEFEAWRSNR